MDNNDNSKNRSVILILLLLLLAGSIGFNIYLYNNKAKVEAKAETEVASSDALRKDLQKELENVKGQLADYKDKVGNLDTTIQRRETELLEKSHQLAKLLKDSKLNYNKYIKAKDEIEKWKYMAEKYMKEVDVLTAENKKLKGQNENLNEEVKTKTAQVNRLEDDNTKLSNKVVLGAQLRAESITITGVRFKSSGKERESSKASQIEKLKICFTVPENHIADNGVKDVFVKVSAPKGQPVLLESMGSGHFTIGGKDAMYTAKDQIEYDNKQQNFCIYWGYAKDAKLVPGVYTIEIFTEGYKMGEKNFTVK